MRNELAAFLESSRDAISTVEIELSTSAQQTLEEAKSLLAAGQKDEAHTLLTTTLKSNPDARALGELLDSTRARPASLGATVPIKRPTAPAPAPLTEQPTAVPAPAAAPAAPAAAGMATHVLPKAASAATTAPIEPKSSKLTWIIGGAAAAALIVAAVIVSRPQDPSTSAPGSAGPTTIPSTTPGTPPVSVSASAAPSGTDTPAAAAAAAPATPTAAGQIASAAPTSPTTPPAAGQPVNAKPGAAATTAPAGSAAAPALSLPTPAAPGSPMTAKQIFYNESKGAGAAANAGLRYRLIQQVADGGESDVDPTKTFKSGDRIRFAFESNIDGYLYVVQQGSSGNWTVLFPNPDINGGRNQIKKFEEYNVPDEAWFSFDDKPGTEQVFVFLSKEVVSVLPGFSRPVTRLESVRAAVVEDLKNSVRSRDLVFERERPAAGAKPSQATFVVNKEEVGKAVSAVIQLVHGQ
jgi:hypothetical protein